MNGERTIPYGVTDFKRIRDENYYCVGDSKRLSLRIFLAVAMMLCGALPAFATWTLDQTANPKTISDGNWTLKLYCRDSTAQTYLISGYTAGSGELDLTTVNADAEITLVGFGDSAMSQNTSVTSVKLPETVTYFGRNCFLKCSNLVSITPFLPGGTTTIATCAFKECKNLVGDLYLTNDAFTVVTVQAFEQVPVTSVHFSTNLESIGGYAFSGSVSTNVFPMDFPKLRSIGDWNQFPIGGDTLRLTCPELSYIGQNVFKSSSFTNLVLSPAITTIAGSAFDSNINLKSIKLVPMRKKNVPVADASIAKYAFKNCYSLGEIELPFRGSYKLAGFSFQDCYNLTNVTFWGVAPATIDAWWISKPSGKASLDYRIRFACSKHQDAMGWRSYATALTDEEKAKAEYPGAKCFGIFKRTDASGYPYTWLVWERSPYGISGLAAWLE